MDTETPRSTSKFVENRFRIGRSLQRADIVIDDPKRTVSSVHAELSLDRKGRWHLTDQSTNGTFVYRAELWMPLRRGFVNPGERVRFGARVVDVNWLIYQARRLLAKRDVEIEPHVAVITQDEKNNNRKGRYVRNPETGEIVWKITD